MAGPAPLRPDEGPSSQTEVVCLGEAMVLLTPADRQPLRSRPGLSMHIGGAESNVACALAHLGHRVQWLGRLGDDPMGQAVADFLDSRGVRLDGVEYDTERRTGVYFKDRAGPRSEVYYYRRGSAASHLSRDAESLANLRGARLLHLSGITPALSRSCDDLMDALLVERDHGAAAVSFDVNFRPGLWSVAQAAPRLELLARAADVVLVGRDEAQTLWGTRTPQEVREMFPDAGQLVVKDNDIGATYFGGDSEVFEPSPRVEVVEPVGAGDAFAAGYLSGWLHGLPPAQRLRHGHLLAAYTLRHESDLPVLPPAELLTEYSSLTGTAWLQVDVSKSAEES